MSSRRPARSLIHTLRTASVAGGCSFDQRSRAEAPAQVMTCDAEGNDLGAIDSWHQPTICHPGETASRGPSDF